jgi:hypothetical protein
VPEATRTWPSAASICRLSYWDDLAAELAADLHHLARKPGRTLAITQPRPLRYVQFASFDGGGIGAEAVGNFHLAGVEQLSPASCRNLAKRGWSRPEVPGAPGKNFWRRWPRGAAPDAVAAIAIATLRDIFAIPSPAKLTIRRGCLGAASATAATRSLTALDTGEWKPPTENPFLKLKPGLVIENALSGRLYTIQELLGAGGFGAVYRVAQAGRAEPLPGECALKVCSDPTAWHREAYFGELLRETSGVVKMHESFAWSPPGRNQLPLYCLVQECIQGGDLARYLKQHPDPWPEAKARREIERLLRVVVLLHSSGAVHRDITPKNVLVTSDRVLKLGDFGIALHKLGKRDVRADAFNPGFLPSGIRSGKAAWRPADDVYHLGQLFALLLAGGGKSKVTAADVKALACRPESKSVIQRSIGERRKRFAGAADMLSALEQQEREAGRQAVVRSLEGRRVVFTGPLSILRAQARRLARKAGAIVEDRVNHQTDVVVLGGQSPHWKAEKKGQKLLDVDRELELGHAIAVIGEQRFLKLAGSGR